MLAKRNYKIWFCVLPVLVVFFALGALISNYYENKNGLDKLAVKVEAQLWKQQQLLEAFTDSLLNTENRGYTYKHIIGDSRLSDNKSASLLVLEGSRYIFWSANLAFSDTDLQHIGNTPSLVKLGPGWYVAKQRQRDSLQVIGLVLIQTEYSSQNAFLKNEFNPDFNIPADVAFNLDPLKGEAIIHSNTSEALFSLSAKEVDKGVNLEVICRWLALFSLFLLLTMLVNFFTKKSLKWNIVLYFVVLLAFRLFIFYANNFLYKEGALFSPVYYASNSFSPSLGELYFHVFFVFWFVVHLFRRRYPLAVNSTAPNNTWFVFSALLASLSALALHFTIRSLVNNSGFSLALYKIADLSVFSLLSYAIMAMLLAMLFLFLTLHLRWFFAKGFWANILAFMVPVLAGLFIFDSLCQWAVVALLLLLLAIFLIFYIYCRNGRKNFNYYFLLMFVSAFYMLAAVSMLSEKKEHEHRKVIADNLSNERDPVAEVLLQDLEDRIAADSVLSMWLQNPVNNDRVANRLQTVYFSGYFKKYNVRAFTCLPESPIRLEQENIEANCFDFFESERQRYGVPINLSAHFTFMNTGTGQITYLGEFNYPRARSADSIRLFIELYSRLASNLIGYPELLIDGVNGESGVRNIDYSYAKYDNKRLVARSGNYDYPFELRFLPDTLQSGFINTHGFNHFYLRVDEDGVVMLSTPLVTVTDYAASYSYMFLFLFLFIVFLFYAARFPIEIGGRLSFKRKITWLFLLTLLTALVIVALVTIRYSVYRFNSENEKNIHEKMQEVLTSLDEDMPPLFMLVDNDREERMLTDKLISLSNVFYTDLNIFSPNGQLYATSRPEMFEKKLLSPLMNPLAYEELAVKRHPYFLNEESIGEMNYYSAYAAYYNHSGTFLGYVNMPYFIKQAEFQQELVSLIVTVVNFYILLIFAGIFLAVLVANQITRPIDEVRKKVAQIDFSEEAKEIDYKLDDELGDLVREYNRMVEKLKLSAQKLAETERESAWRQMAQQIAHEIKNPLTPMRLSIQHLLRMKREGNPQWQERFVELSKSLIEQIDVLAQTASEFSDFAKMNQSLPDKFDLIGLLNEQRALFSGFNNIDFILKIDAGIKEAVVLIQRNALQRVLTNLINNAIQSVGEAGGGKVSMVISEEDGYYTVSIADNGKGVSDDFQDKLFKPNFTTKSSGTGLGLAISKSIVETAKGKIAFSPVPEGGACFTIYLPKIE